MSKHTYYILVAAIMVGLLPFVPWMIEFRTRVLRGLHLTAFARWHEENSSALTAIVRVILAAGAAVLAIIGFMGH